MEMVTDQTPADPNVKPKLKRKRKERKREDSDGCAVQGTIQKDRSMHDIKSGKNGMMAASSYSQEKPMQLDFTAKWSQESPKSGAATTTDPLKKPSKSEKKRVKRKVNDGCAVESMDLKDTNMHVTENGKNGIIAEPCSPVKPVELDSTVKLCQENPKSSDGTTTNPLKKLSNSKRKIRRGKRKANEGMNQKDKSMHDIENGKNGMIVEPCSPDKPMELGSTAKLSQKNPKYAVDTTTNPLEKPSKSERKWLRRVKREANGGCAVQVMDQKDKNMYDIENGKAEPCSPGKPVELDSTAKLSQENPKSGDDTTNNPLEKLSKSKKKHRGGKREANEGMSQKDKSMSDTENGKNVMIVKPGSPEKHMELGSTAKLSQENPKSAVETTANPLEKPSKSERKRLRRVKKEANGGCAAVQVMDQKDKNMYDIENGNAEPCSPGKPVELDSTAKLSQENPKSGDDTTNNPLEKLSKSKKKHRGGKREANEGMSQKDKSMSDTENGKNGMIVKPGSPEKHMELGSTAKLSQENPKSAVETTANPLEKPSKSERKRLRRVKKEANGGCAVQGMDQKDKNMYDTEKGKDGMIAEPCSSGKPMELDYTAKLSQENPKYGEDTLPNPLEKLSKSKRKRLKKAKKKAAAKLKSESMDHNESGGDTLTNPLNNLSKYKRKSLRKATKKVAADLGPESMNHTNIVSNLSLADASDAYAGDNVNYGTDLSQESRCSTGNGICNKVDMQHKSSIVTSETQNNLLADPYRITQRRKLLILDVNGLLADVVFPAPQGCQPDTRTLGRAIFKRPFYLDFLNFCFEKFDVGIWSSRTKRVLDKVVDYLLGDLKLKLRFCWDASHCTETKFKTLENRHKPMVFKELRKLWEKHDPSLPWKKGDYDESNTLLVDDSPYKALLNPMHTGVFPCSYTYHNKSDNLLGPGGEIRVYLKGLAAAGNVQHYVAQNPFGQSAINETNPSWNFYSYVLQSLLSTSG